LTGLGWDVQSVEMSGMLLRPGETGVRLFRVARGIRRVRFGVISRLFHIYLGVKRIIKVFRVMKLIRFIQVIWVLELLGLLGSGLLG
jgi:hypothetical protein